MLRVHVCTCARAAEGEKWQPGRLGVNVGARSHVTRRQLANWFPSSGPTELTGSREERRNHSLHLQPPPSPHHSITPSLVSSSPCLPSIPHPSSPLLHPFISPLLIPPPLRPSIPYPAISVTHPSISDPRHPSVSLPSFQRKAFYRPSSKWPLVFRLIQINLD